MVTLKTSGKATLRREQLLDQFFPGWKEEAWKCSGLEPGFTPVPRTLSFISILIRELREEKGDDPSRVYLDLWFRAFKGQLVEVRDPRECAYCCGFTGERGLRSWHDRIMWLADQGFIRTAKMYGNEISHIFLRDPDMVVWKLKSDGKLPATWKVDLYEMKMKSIKARRWEPTKKVLDKKKIKTQRVPAVPVSQSA